MRIYATREQVSNQWGIDPEKVNPTYLTIASLMVERFTRLDRYDVDAEGYPTEPEVRETFALATGAQVAYWIDAGLNPIAGAAGQAAQITSQSVPGGSVSYASPMTAEQRGQAATTLCETACQLLQAIGLGRTEVIVW